jgi:arsenite methyltransferase
VGFALLLASAVLPTVFGYLLIALAALSGVVALLLRVITSRGRRQRARDQMLNTISWRGDGRVLDVGCGNGFLLIDAAKRLTSGTATGIDLWKAEAGEQSGAVAWRNAGLEGVRGRVEIQDADARQMPFANNTFDMVVSSLMLHHAGSGSDRHQVLREMRRVLKPGGTIVLHDMLPLIANATNYFRSDGMRVTRSTGLTATLTVREGK